MIWVGYAAHTEHGLLWGELDSAALRQNLHDPGNEAVRAWLGLLGDN